MTARQRSIVSLSSILEPNYRSDAHIGHLAVYRAQVSMFTPHEVYSYARDQMNWGPAPNHTVAVNVHKSEWLLCLASATSRTVITTALYFTTNSSTSFART
jgi:hypothetical protein